MTKEGSDAVKEYDQLPTAKEDNKKWYVFYVKAKHERKAEALLNRDGFTTYLPIVKTLKQWSDRKKSVEEPLFKSYIFVFVVHHQLYDVLQNPSIIKYIRFNDEPATIHQKHIDLIKSLILNKTQFEASTPSVKVGETIRLKTGPFKGQKGIVKEIRGKKKLLILLESINFTLEIVMD
jgi:transcription antitermination factor NusG